MIYLTKKNNFDQQQFTYRTKQIDTLRMKATEEERLEEINKQIYNLQNLKQVKRFV
jgi:DNA repair ATPase RecN